MAGFMDFARALGDALKAVGSAILDRLVADMSLQLGQELGARDVRRRYAIAAALREALAAPEHALPDEARARVLAGLDAALSSGQPGRLLFPLEEAMREGQWSALQRFALLQRLAPTGGRIEIGAIRIGAPASSGGGEAERGEAAEGLQEAGGAAGSVAEVLDGPAANDDGAGEREP